jgi:DNA-directed RNA polymerase subunit RPC12/RpoP
MEQKLKCTECHREVDAIQVLDLAAAYWPHEWCSFTCPYCRGHVLFVVKDGIVTIGEADGFPGPTFMPLSRQRVKGIGAELDGETYVVRQNERTWRIPYRIGAANQAPEDTARKLADPQR